LRCFVLCTTSLLTVLVGCATGQKSGHTEAIESHVYARPLDDVLAAATTLLTQRGWRVERSGDCTSKASQHPPSPLPHRMQRPVAGPRAEE
jgi:hypothetical protein